MSAPDHAPYFNAEILPAPKGRLHTCHSFRRLAPIGDELEDYDVGAVNLRGLLWATGLQLESRRDSRQGRKMEWLLVGLIALLVFSLISMGADAAKRDGVRAKLRAMPDFNADYVVIKTPVAGIAKGIAFDARRRLAMVVLGDVFLPFALDDLLSCDVVSDPRSGSVMARFVINDLRMPAHFIDFIEMTGGGNTPSAFAIIEAGELQAYFRVLKGAGQRHAIAG